MRIFVPLLMLAVLAACTHGPASKNQAYRMNCGQKAASMGLCGDHNSIP